MNLYHRCISEFTKPDVIEIHKNNLEAIPVSAKTAILSLLCKRGYFADTSVLQLLVNSKVPGIDFGECVVTDDMLNCLHVCKNMRKLDLSLRRRQERHITTNALLSLFPNFKSLEVLIIPDCKEFNDDVTKVICENCEGLKLLNIQKSSITDHSLCLIGQHLNSLSVLNVFGTSISDRGIEFLVKSSLVKTLQEVNIDKCPQVTAAASASLIEKCRNVNIFTCGSSTGETMCFAFKGLLPRNEMKQVFWKL